MEITMAEVNVQIAKTTRKELIAINANRLSTDHLEDTGMKRTFVIPAIAISFIPLVTVLKRLVLVNVERNFNPRTAILVPMVITDTPIVKCATVISMELMDITAKRITAIAHAKAISPEIFVKSVPMDISSFPSANPANVISLAL